MASQSLTYWLNRQAAELNELEYAHRAMEGGGPGRRYATQQINDAYVIALASQFQMFCRDLHQESAEFVAAMVQPATCTDLVLTALTQARQLKRGNAQSGSIGSDFGRFNIDVWVAVKALDTRNKQRMKRLDQLNIWRNAIAHQDRDFTPAEAAKIKGTASRLHDIRSWRSACHELARALDRVMAEHLKKLTGQAPW